MIDSISATDASESFWLESKNDELDWNEAGSLLMVCYQFVNEYKNVLQQVIIEYRIIGRFKVIFILQDSTILQEPMTWRNGRRIIVSISMAIQY